MGFRSVTAAMAAFVLVGCSPEEREPLPYQNAKTPFEKRVDDLLGRMTKEEKREFLRHSAGVMTQPIWRLGIPGVKTFEFRRNAMAMAAAWDPELVAREARATAAEALASNRRQVIGPDPAELSDDPWLAARLAVAWVGALQEEGVIATLKGFGRGDENAQLPFEAAVEEAGLWAVEPAPSGRGVIEKVLKGEWGFKGFVVDANQGDDDEVRRRLRALFGVGVFDVDEQRPVRLAPDLNESVVLMRNEGGLLPLAPSVRSIAVIGGASLAVPSDCHAAVTYGSASEAVAMAQRSEIVLMFSDDAALIEAVAGVNPKTIVVTDRPIALPKRAPAVLTAWGRRDIGPFLFGQSNPSGRLPVAIGPEFAFGAGLSYTTFAYSDLQIFPKTPRYGELVRVAVRIANTGKRAGAEVAELFVKDRLKGFQRVVLAAGETRTVTFELDRRATSFYDSAIKAWATIPGVFDVALGSSPRDIRLRGSFELFR